MIIVLVLFGFSRGARLGLSLSTVFAAAAGADCSSSPAQGTIDATVTSHRRLNEESVIGRGPEPARARLPGGNLQIVVSSDASSDRTEAIALQYPGVQVISDPRGKVAAQDHAGATNDGEIVAFSDANCTWSTDALRTLVRAFAGPDVADCGPVAHP